MWAARLIVAGSSNSAMPCTRVGNKGRHSGAKKERIVESIKEIRTQGKHV